MGLGKGRARTPELELIRKQKLSISTRNSFKDEGRRDKNRIILFNPNLPKYKGYQIWKGNSDYPTIKVNGTRILLHKYIWIEANGTIPKGYEVHHIDMDKGNYKLSNLILLDHQSHMRYHKGWEKNKDGEWLKPCNRCGIKKTTSHYYKQVNGFANPCRSCREKAKWN